jgi:hypothetical protein
MPEVIRNNVFPPSRITFGGTMPMDAPRISIADARWKVQSGRALLVCAYEDEEDCRSVWVPGAISLAEFRVRYINIPWSQEIIFYCG